MQKLNVRVINDERLGRRISCLENIDVEGTAQALAGEINRVKADLGKLCGSVNGLVTDMNAIMID